MFARAARLPTARTVKRLYAKGRRSVTRTALLFVADNRALQSRFAVVCGRKVSGTAVVRNRLKRVARAVLEAHSAALLRRDFLAVIRPSAVGNEAELRRELGSLLAPYRQSATVPR